MQNYIKISILCAVTLVAARIIAAEDAPIVVEGIYRWPSQNSADKLHMASGVTTSVVFRSDSARIDPSDGRGWTYQHHPGIAIWRGRMYVAWDSGLKDEDRWPARQLYSMSEDGRTWAKPLELFAQGNSTPLRMWFYLANKDTMLAIAGLRVNTAKTIEKNKSGLVVRRINADHSLGPAYILRKDSPWLVADVPDVDIAYNTNVALPLYTKSSDVQFVAACKQLLADRVFLMQQDFGYLMDMPERISWCRSTDWGAGGNRYSLPTRESFGRALSFFHRKNGGIVGLGKLRWATVSHDEGKTWSQPVKPPTLITGSAKVWGQRTADGRYALVYNPHETRRYPLVVVASDDGVHFNDMCVISAGTDPMRYAGDRKSTGAQYVRGFSEWADDGTWKDNNALWVTYSMNEEDILVSRISLPIKPETNGAPVDATRADEPKKNNIK